MMTQNRAAAATSVGEVAAAEQRLAAITRAVSTINGLNLQIAAASDQQNDAAAEVTRNIHNIRSIAEQTTANAAALNAASAEMQRQADQLSGVVARFRL